MSCRICQAIHRADVELLSSLYMVLILTENKHASMTIEVMGQDWFLLFGPSVEIEIRAEHRRVI